MTTQQFIDKINAFDDAESLKTWAQDHANELASSPDRDELRRAYRIKFQVLSWGCPAHCSECMIDHPRLSELGGCLCEICEKTGK